MWELQQHVTLALSDATWFTQPYSQPKYRHMPPEAPVEPFHRDARLSIRPTSGTLRLFTCSPR